MAESPGASLFSGDHFPVLVPAFSQECSSHSSTFQGEQFPSFSFPSSPSRITYSLGSQLINNSISWGWREWIEFPCIFFFFFACSQPLAAFHPQSSSRCCAASSRRSTRSSGASWGSHCWVRASGSSCHCHTKCSCSSWALLDEAQIPLDQECCGLMELGSAGWEFEDVLSAKCNFKMRSSAVIAA